MPPPPDLRVFLFGPFEFRAEDRSLWRDGKRVPLPPRAADILFVLLSNHGHLVERAELKRLWNAAHVEDASINFQVLLTRKALRQGIDEECIETVRQRGFRFVGPVTVRDGEVPVPVPVPTNGDSPSRSENGQASPAVLPAPASAIEPMPEGSRLEQPADRDHSGWSWTAAAAAGLVLAAVATFAVFGPESATRLEVGSVQLVTDDGVSKSIGTLVLDDGHVYYADAADIRRLHAVPLGGGLPVRVFDESSEFRLLDVHAPSGEYLVRRDVPGEAPELWIVGKEPAAPRRVEGLRCDTGAWSPDGTEVACASSASGLRIANRDGTEVRVVSPFIVGGASGIRWSSDGSRIRFTVGLQTEAGSSNAIWEADPRTAVGWPLFADERNGRVYRCCGDWTPDGRYYVFESLENGATHLSVLTERRGWFRRRIREVTRLTPGPMSYHSPRVSRDGGRVFAFGLHAQGELVRYDQTTRAFALYLPGISGTWITFAPDRKSVAYIGHPDKKLWRADVDGSTKQVLTPEPFENDGSVWSPDGKWIAFLSRRSGTQLRIHLIPGEGGAAFPISDDDRRQGIPTWSPDGRRLVFGDVPAVYGEAEGNEVLREYDVERRTFRVLPGSAGLWTARWSRDGRYLAAVRIADSSLHLFDFQTGQWRRLPAAHVDNVTWSSDAQFIYYHTNGYALLLRRIRVADGTVEDVVDLRHMPLAAYWWIGLAPDDSPIALRRRGGTEIYALTLERR